jgi:hypothetical protein
MISREVQITRVVPYVLFGCIVLVKFEDCESLSPDE